MECGSSQTPVVVHLDSNCELPQSTDRQMLGALSVSTQLKWQQHFKRYL